MEEQAPPILEKLEECLKQNKGGDGWLVGDDVSVAEFFKILDTCPFGLH